MSPQNQTDAPSYTITCQMSHETAALERLCQVIRIRGFRIAKMAVEAVEDQLAIALTVEGSRPVGMLQTQLQKLHTVAQVELNQPAQITTATAQTA
jgi:acetolactate synthase II small subunit